MKTSQFKSVGFSKHLFSSPKTLGALLLALVPALHSEAAPLFFDGPRELDRAPYACRQLGDNSKAARAQWLKELSHGSAIHMVISAEMGELGVTNLDAPTRQDRLRKAFANNAAKHNLLYMHYRDYQDSRLDVQQTVNDLARFRKQDFGGELGYGVGYLYGLLAEATNFNSRPMILEAYRMAATYKNHDAAVRYVSNMMEWFPERLQTVEVQNYVRKLINSASDHYTPAMSLRSKLWAAGYYGTDQKKNKYYADLYANVAALTSLAAKSNIEPSQASKLLAANDIKASTEAAEAALAYMKSRNVQNLVPDIRYRYLCPWNELAKKE